MKLRHGVGGAPTLGPSPNMFAVITMVANGLQAVYTWVNHQSIGGNDPRRAHWRLDNLSTSDHGDFESDDRKASAQKAG